MENVVFDSTDGWNYDDFSIFASNFSWNYCCSLLSCKGKQKKQQASTAGVRSYGIALGTFLGALKWNNSCIEQFSPALHAAGIEGDWRSANGDRIPWTPVSPAIARADWYQWQCVHIWWAYGQSWARRNKPAWRKHIYEKTEKASVRLLLK